MILSIADKSLILLIMLTIAAILFILVYKGFLRSFNKLDCVNKFLGMIGIYAVLLLCFVGIMPFII